MKIDKNEKAKAKQEEKGSEGLFLQIFKLL